MISEDQQEQAALYALGLLDADEADAFERALPEQPELAGLVLDLREGTAALALAANTPDARPPAALRDRVLRRVAAEAVPGTVPFARVVPEVLSRPASPVVPAPVPLVRPRHRWVPWTLAASLLGCAAFLAAERGRLVRQVGRLQALAAAPTPAPLDALTKVVFLELEPTPDAPVQPRAAVLWDPAEHRGVLRITQLAPPTSGKDYQLWAVEAARKEPVNAGLVRVDAEGRAVVSFRPDAVPGDNRVAALAISLEPAGGSPTKQGPILFIGKL